MARPKNTDKPDTAETVELTLPRIERLTLPAGKYQAFLRDSKAPGLRVRVTGTGHKAFVFEGKLDRKTIRRTIGDVRAWTIEQARAEARRLAVLIDEGINPTEQERQEKEQAQAQAQAQQAKQEAQAVTVAQVWAAYIEARRPHWGELHLRDHIGMMAEGGKPKQRGKGLTTPGPLAAFAPMRLADLTPQAIEAWAQREGTERPARARLAKSLLQGFLNWCQEQSQFAQALPTQGITITRQARQNLGKAKPKTDSLAREQLPAWFEAVQSITNPTIAAYVQTLLLTGARPNEILALKWEQLDTRWRSITIRDKDESKGGEEGFRVIPLTPYVHCLLANLPRRSEYVFSGETGKPLHKPNTRHTQACAVAGLPHITLHGLRRSFGSLAEWLELPAGVIAQIQGHKPSATAEKHYRVRPLDLLRVHHEKLEAWILEQAGIAFEPQEQPQRLRVVAG